MRKLFIVSIVLLSFMGIALAAPVTIIDPNGQDSVKVSGESLKSSNRARKIFNGRETVLIYNDTAGCNIQAITAYLPVANETIAFFDLANANTGSDALAIPEFEVTSSINNETVTIPCYGAPFENGIYVLNSNANSTWSIVYDY